MRRWLPWTTVTLLLLLVTGIIVVARKPTAPFGFLGQHEAVFANLGPTVGPDVRRIAFEYQANWDRHIQQATQELLGRGYKPMRSSTAKQLAFVVNAPTESFSIVVLTKDQRLSRPDFMLHRRQPGWITVDILGTPPPTLLDRIRSWLGL